MENIREILAANLKENRRKRGITQEQFAEKADVSTHYIAMIETCKAFPTAEMLERLAKTLEIEAYRLFNVEAAPDEAAEWLRQAIVSDMKQVMPDMEQVITNIRQEMLDMKQVVLKAIQETLADESKSKDKV